MLLAVRNQESTHLFSSVYIYIYIYIYIYMYEVHTISFHTFFVWALLLIVNTWNSCPLRNYLLRLQCTCCTVPTTSRTPHGSPLVWACQWPPSQPLSSPQLSRNDSLWAKEITKSHREQSLDYRDGVDAYFGQIVGDKDGVVWFGLVGFMAYQPL